MSCCDGWDHTDDAKEINSIIKNTVKRASEETKLKMSLSQKGNKNHFYGKTHN